MTKYCISHHNLSCSLMSQMKLSSKFISKFWEYSSDNLPNQETLEKVRQHLSCIQRIAKNWVKNCEIRPYGSITNGFLSKDTSDFDLTCLFRNKLYKHPHLYSKNLRKMLDSEYGEGSWSYICTPRLYLLTTQLEDGTEIEITFNNITGLLNSEYVRTLAEIDSRFHKLGYFIKHFVNSREIFDLKKKLNSFSLICMLIVFLQDQCNPPVLPRIIQKSSSIVKKEMVTASYTKSIGEQQEQYLPEYAARVNTLDANFEFDHKEIQTFMSEEINQESVSQLFKRFIHFYFCGGGFDPVHDVVNTRTGRIEKIKANKKTLNPKIRVKLQDACIAVMDPFDMSYCPSANFELKSYRKGDSMIEKLIQFIH
ncbi:unnamed protein product [Moneuplotes crassus]|uniref:Poly(A) RNA polymerase mitochondrial-like central palm domain-containing protein n=1 Tax=Euplotes crassus TaxID=5936 RepID=A0AAD1U6C8_EUPCR|nr:unnamed protein product [Moneuplotes crassus]